ncbi:MAG TPA: hypothetical protein VLD17_06670 [Gemmatimonadaceae bacterium]|nr:hypothetical protein [Gemmatimonadaceae bacterium]
MSASDETVQPYLATIEVGGRRLDVSVLISYDGIEYGGRLWFAETEWEDEGIPDRGNLPGRSRQEVEQMARHLTEEDLIARYRRAAASRRRFIALRSVTEDFLAKVRYLNQVAISMRAGLIDTEGAAQEIDYTEHQLHELVRQFREVAGVEQRVEA